MIIKKRIEHLRNYLLNNKLKELIAFQVHFVFSQRLCLFNYIVTLKNHC